MRYARGRIVLTVGHVGRKRISHGVLYPHGTTRSPYLRLCSLGNGVRPQFLQLEYLHRFTQGLIEGALMNHHDLFRKVRVSSSFHTTVAALTSLSYSQHPELLLLL